MKELHIIFIIYHFPYLSIVLQQVYITFTLEKNSLRDVYAQWAVFM